jgi:N-acetylmuramoyl-L-alanine amidase
MSRFFKLIYKKKCFYFIFILFFYSCKSAFVSTREKLKISYPIKFLQAKYFDNRIKFLILHYTAANFSRSMEILQKGILAYQVSAHYLIPDKGKKIFSLVKEDKRAWHAGLSNWGNRTNLNDSSIGIEIVNLGYQDSLFGEKIWYKFNENQIQMIISLAKDIIKRYDIKPNFVLGHCDISPGRKIDPGPLFPWESLAKEGIGAWYDKKEVERISFELKDQLIDLGDLQKNLKTYGYKIEETGLLDEQTKEVLQVFQMHFRPNNYSGKIDVETIAILKNLIQKYIK